jgi:hypothetical protein
MKRKTTNSGARIWNDAIAGFVKIANGKSGAEFKADVLTNLEVIAPDGNWTRQGVWQWLKPAGEGRPEPKYGNGVLLLHACARAAKSKEWE